MPGRGRNRVLTIAATSARSVALAGFGLDPLIEIGASTVVIWELSSTGDVTHRLVTWDFLGPLRGYEPDDNPNREPGVDAATIVTPLI